MTIEKVEMEDRTEEIFSRARRIRDHGQRAELLARECGNDDALRDSVESLLAFDDSESPLDRGLEGFLSLEGSAEPPRLGNYRILGVLGEGGWGVVYEAEQEQPRRHVALKVLRPGAMGERSLQRFDHEREILGLLQHPGIAQIFDAGTAETPLGNLPYFAMEMIDGLPLDRYAADRGLGIRDRVQLVIRVCEAVNHAHQKGVVHRDLKPGNVLVDRSGQPKVLDFGIARATDSDVQTTTGQTDVGQLVGTVPYMSPEQASGDPRQLDVRSDVYTLGVLLYELLTDSLPYDVRELMLHEAVRVIREDDPTPLSSTNRVLRGDLETIAAKALEKDKLRRYQSALELAADLRRYLDDEPVIARPASATYQMRKFVRRHRLLTAGVAMILALVCVGFFLVDRERRVAESERADAEFMTGLLLQILKYPNPNSGNPHDITVVELLDETVPAALQALEPRPELRAVFLHAIGHTYEGLGRQEEALEAHRDAVALRIQSHGSEDPLTLEWRGCVTSQLYNAGRYVEVEAELRGLLELQRKVLGDENRETLDTLRSLGFTCYNNGKLLEARDLLEQAVGLFVKTQGQHDPYTLQTRSLLATVLSAVEGPEEGYEILQEVVPLLEVAAGPDAPLTFRAKRNLGIALKDMRRFPEAYSLFTELAAAQDRILGPLHSNTLDTRARRLDIQRRMGMRDEATRSQQELVGELLASHGPRDFTALNALGDLAGRLSNLTTLAENEEIARAMLSALETADRDHDQYWRHRGTAALLLRQAGRLAEAEEILLEVVPEYECRFGSGHRETAALRRELAHLLMDVGKDGQSIAQLLQVLADAECAGATLVTGVGARIDLAARWSWSGEWEQAERLLVRTLSLAERTLGREDLLTRRIPQELESVREGLCGKREKAWLELQEAVGPANSVTLAAAASLTHAMRRLGEVEHALEHAEEALGIAREELPDDNPVIAELRAAQGLCLLELDDTLEAESALLEAYEVLQGVQSMETETMQELIRGLVRVYEELDDPTEAKIFRTPLPPEDDTQYLDLLQS